MRVLHIDDSLEIRKMYTDMFTLDKHNIESVSDGKTGLDLAVKNNYDLILLDVSMPKYSGVDFLRDLKNLKPSELKKVVVVSVMKFKEDQINEFLTFGIHSVEEKPSNFENLETIQKDVLLK